LQTLKAKRPAPHAQDMFHSRHPRAELHAAARAASGGPVYVSDAPGAHEGALLRRLVLPDGSVLRAALPARPTADTLFSDVLRDCCSLLKARVPLECDGEGVFRGCIGRHRKRRGRAGGANEHAAPAYAAVHQQAALQTLGSHVSEFA